MTPAEPEVVVTAYRHAAYDSPWWANPNSQDGRFHTAQTVPTQYWCLHPLGPAAEMLRHNVGPAGAEDADTVRLNLWAARVPLTGVAIIDFDDCARQGIAAAELVGDNYQPTQALAARMHSGGAAGILVPSAALPGTHNLILFGTKLLHPYLFQPTTAAEVPTGHLTDGARPPAEVTIQVCWFGAAHVALDEWSATGSYRPLNDPIATRW